MFGDIYVPYEDGYQPERCHYCNGNGLDYDYDEECTVSCPVCLGEGFRLATPDKKQVITQKTYLNNVKRNVQTFRTIHKPS